MGIGFSELMVILVIIMIIFGAGKLPEIGSAFGRSIKNFKTSMKEAQDDEPASEPSAQAPAQTATPAQESAAPAQPAPAQQSAATPQAAQSAPAQTAQTAPKTAKPAAKGAKKEEEDIIDQAIREFKEEFSGDRIHTIRTRGDGLVQDRDVFTESVKKVPFGMKRSDRGVSRDIF